MNTTKLRRSAIALLLCLCTVFGMIAVLGTSAEAATTVTYDNILEMSKTLADYVEKNKALPAKIQEESITLTTAQYAYYGSQVIVKLNAGTKSGSFTVKSVSAAPNPQGTVTAHNILKANFVDMANRAATYVDNNNNVHSNYIICKTGEGQVRYTDFTFCVAKILRYYYENKALPNYNYVEQWNYTTNSATAPDTTNLFAITTQPAAASVAEGKTVSFSVKVNNAKSYQWQYSYNGTSWANVGTTIKSATTATLSFTTTAKYNGYRYRCVVTGNNGKTLTTAAALLTVTGNNAAAITTQPKAATVDEHKNVSFSITASNAKSYQWQYSRAGKTSWVNVGKGIPSGKTATLTFAAEYKYNGYRYRCVVTGNNGRTVYSDPAKLTIHGENEAYITTQPKAVSVKESSAATFTVAAKNAMSYQWQVCKSGSNWVNVGTDVTGGTTAKLSFTAKTTYNGYQYHCVVTGKDGKTVTSSAAKLTVTANGWYNTDNVSSVKTYLEETKYAQSNSTTIKKLAQTAVKNGGSTMPTSTYQAMVNMSKYLHTNTSYDPATYSETRYGAIKTWQRRSGCCADLAHLVVACARSVGVPARYRHIQVYKGDSWAFGHYQAEVYVQSKWQLIDLCNDTGCSTYGYLDYDYYNTGAYRRYFNDDTGAKSLTRQNTSIVSGAANSD